MRRPAITLLIRRVTVRLGGSLIVCVVVAGAFVSSAGPASASGQPGVQPTLTMALSPSAGSNSTPFDLHSVDPCPPPPNKDYPDVGVHVYVINSPATHVYFDSSAHQSGIGINPDRSWDEKVDFSWADPPRPRNGRYWVLAVCLNPGNPDTAANEGVYAEYAPQLLTIENGNDYFLRVAGSDRVATAIAVSHDLYDDAGAGGVVLTRSDSFADSLAGTPLAASVGGPLLLTPGSALDTRTGAEIDRVLGGSGTVYILGGASAIAETVADTLRSSGYDVVRLAGPDRFATATAIADEIGDPSAILLADGTDFPDGLVAGAAAPAAGEASAQGGDGVVVLTNGSALPDATRAYLSQHPAAATYAIGSAASGAAPSATAINGGDPATTSTLVAARFFNSPYAVAVASSSTFADGLAGGVHAAAFGAPLLLTNSAAVPQAVQDYLIQNSDAVLIGFLYGGEAVVTTQAEHTLNVDISQ